MRRVLLAICAALAAAIPATVGLASSPPGHLDTMNIIPPGSNGNVNAVQGFQAETSGQKPPNFDNQWQMYDALNRLVPSNITDSVLFNYYKDARLGGNANQIVSTESPMSGVTIKRDTFGVPHITGTTAEDVAFGAGYAGIEDRMFLTDILRHVGASDMAAFVGPTAGNIAMDQAQLQIAPYTQQEAQDQILSAEKRYGAEGTALVHRLDSFIAGMNAAQHALCPGAFGLPVPGENGVGLGPNCPVEYGLLQKNPRDYTRADIIYIASLVGGIFGKGGGNEFADALWFENLREKYGEARAVAMYNDLREKNDPEAFTTATTSFPYNVGGLDPTKPGVALPVPGAPTAPGTGSDAGGSALPIPAPPIPGTTAYAQAQQKLGVIDTPLGHMNLGFTHHDESNALLVSAAHSKNGHPVVVFGPQTGYFTPQLLDEVDLHGPGVDARGVSFAGTQFIVELGHGVDYAWSATSADGDLVDTVMARLCNPDGSAPTVNSTYYIDNGKCVPIDSYVHDEGVALPNAGAQQPPQELRFNVMRVRIGDRLGIVQFRTMATDAAGHEYPVAVATERSTYGHEADSAIGFARVNNPSYVHDATDFENAFGGVDYTFNWFYADDRDIAYKVSGLLPMRPSTVEPDLPRWDDPQYDWQGFLPQAGLPHQINPPRGFLTSWNNRQAPNFTTADDQWGHSAVHRVNLLANRIQALINRGPITRGQLVGAMMDAATADLRGEELLPLALQVIGNDPALKDATSLLQSWVAAGAHRVDRGRTGHYDHQAAIALFDTWWDDNGKGDGGLAKDTLRPVLGDLVDKLPYSTDDHPRKGLGSSWDTVAWYGYVSKSLRQVLGQPVQAPYSENYCGSLATCQAALRASLATAVQRAESAQGVSTVSQLTYDKTKDDIVSSTAGLVGVSPIDWQNRPTFQQVINFTTHRLRPAVLGVTQTRAAVTRQLPRTGASGLIPLAALALLGAAQLVRVWRRRDNAMR